MTKSGDVKTLVVFGIGLLTVATAIMLWQRSVQRWIESDQLEGNAYEAIQKLKQLESHLAIVESEHRDSAVLALGKDARTLRQLAYEDVSREMRWENLERLLFQRLDQLQNRTNSNKETAEQLRLLLQTLGEDEDRRLHQHIEHKQAAMFRTVNEVTAILAGGTVLFLCGFRLLRREVAARRAAEAMIRDEHAALEKAMHDLDQSHWHLDNVAEFLPICMQCGRVKTADAHWETIIEYFRKNELLFTHGLCPECDAKVRKDFSEKRNGVKPT
jgi:hypothetical protein